MGLARGLGSLLALQLFSRVLSFGLNTLLARSLGPEWYGFANVQLQLLGASVLFVPKEGFRRVAQRVYPGGGGTPLCRALNVAWLSVPAAGGALLLVAAAGVGGGWDELMGTAEASQALLILALAAVCEAACEPGWVYAQANSLLPQRAFAEGMALVVKALVAALLIVRATQRSADKPTGLGLAFACAQLAYSLCFLLLLNVVAARHAPTASLWPRRFVDGDDGRQLCWLAPSMWRVTAETCAQAIQKYLLTEGERLILVATLPMSSQGSYALVTNLGSLVGMTTCYRPICLTPETRECSPCPDGDDEPEVPSRPHDVVHRLRLRQCTHLRSWAPCTTSLLLTAQHGCSYSLLKR